MGRFAGGTIQRISYYLIMLILLCSLSPSIFASSNIEAHQHAISVEQNTGNPSHRDHHSDDATEAACCVGGDAILGAVSELLRLLMSSGLLLLLSIYSLHKYTISNDFFNQIPYKIPLFPPARILNCTFTI